MYQSKLLGKNRSQLYNPDYEQRIIKKNLQLKEIEQALINNEFQLYYQPKVNMVTGDVFGVEALIRWLHPKKGLIPPLDFLSTIDATPLEIKVGDWVISEALKQLNDWQQQGLKLEVSVNISSNHLTSPSFFMGLENRLAKYDASNAKYLQLEILESSALADINTINHIVNTCQERLGVSFALDDFGTGYSSLTHLRNLPVDTIKIDRSFVRDILDDPSDYSIINSVIALTKSFNRNVIAEGVESTNHGLILLLMGCEQAQGYGIAKPMPADKFKQWLDSYQPNNSWVESANIERNKKQSSLDIFRIVSTYWKDRFERNILLSPDNLLPWPIMDNQQCQCAHWINQQKQEKLFEKNALLQLEKSYQDVHFIASSIKAKYNQGEIETARTMLSSLTIAFEGMLTITESFQ
ncbi:EAL domain-containing protein [Psychromonas sp. KJ10-10]|uniref:EAL domain-containing protein n=1 Tax=Psychromonas sp. KJ10-10 TaxID=3391823 RepID=UPI0039B3CD8C